MYRKKLKRIVSFLVALVMVLTLAFWNWVADTFEVEAAVSSTTSTTRTSVHDPSIVKANGKYYIFGSHLDWSVSSDMRNWNRLTTNVNTDYRTIFAHNAEWAALGGNQGVSTGYDISGNLWAPDVIYNEAMGKWCLYMSINGDWYYSSIAMATADNIEGPYTYAGTVVYSGFDNSAQASKTDFAKVTGSNSVPGRYLSNGSWNSSYGPNAIDPCVLYDANGDLWMSYGSWFGGIYMIKLDNNTGLRDYSYTYSTVANQSDQYLGIKISGGYGCTGEGSYIVYDKAAGYYYLYMSYGGLCATTDFSNYHMRLFRSKNITGPYTDAAGNSAICTSASEDQSNKGIKIMGNYAFSSLKSVASGELSANGYMSPGHNSAFIDDDGQRYVVYHTRFNNGTEGHQVRVHQQFVNQDGWLVTAVYENLGSKISNNYSDSEIIGQYEFVNHGNSAGAMLAPMLGTTKVTLNSDGTITGGVTGTWSRTKGSYYCTMTIGGVTYKGVFFKQYDESDSHNEVMTFTLVGSNNQAIWGSKWEDTSLVGGNSKADLDGVYYIKNKFSGKYLDVTDGSGNDGANIQQFAFNGYDSQKFKLVSDGNGYYTIYTGATNYTKCVDVWGASAADGTNIAQGTYYGNDCQKFEIVEVTTGVFAIKTKNSGTASCLDVYAWNPNDGGNIVQWTCWGGDCQLWYLEAATAKGNSTANLDGTYYIKNKFSGKYLDVTNASADNGANIQQWEFNGCSAQQFKLVSDGNGYYTIYTGCTDYTKSLDVWGASAADGTNIAQGTYYGNDCQKFEIVEVTNGIFAIKTKNSGAASCLDVYAWSQNNGGNVVQWSYWGGDCQLWYLESAEPEGNSTAGLDGTYYIKNKFSNLYLDVVNGSSDDGANIQQWYYNGYDAQKFKLVSDGNGYYTIYTGASGYTKCIDISAESTEDGANVNQWSSLGTDCQKFEIVEVSSGVYAIKTKHTGAASCLDVYAWSTNGGGNIAQWLYWGGDCQLWYMEAVN